jgi:hypothetical protein
MTAEKKATTQQIRNKNIVVRVSEEEYKRIEELAKEKGLTKSDFIRKTILKVKPVRKEKVKCKEIKELLLEVKRIGINLNQLAKLGNSLLKREDLTTEEVLIHLEKIANSLEEIEKDLNLLLFEVLK